MTIIKLYFLQKFCFFNLPFKLENIFDNIVNVDIVNNPDAMVLYYKECARDLEILCIFTIFHLYCWQMLISIIMVRPDNQI